MLSAESFISNIDAQALSMEESEFENNMESARALLSGLSTDMDGLSDQNDQSAKQISVEQLIYSKHQAMNYKTEMPKSSEAKSGRNVTYAKDQEPITKVSSLSELENMGANMLLKEDKPSQIFQDYPYLFAQVGDLTVNDVEDLLNNYKQLVFRYVCLSKGLGLGGATSTLPPSLLHTQVQHQAETIKESEYASTVEKNDESHEDTIKTNNPSNQVSISYEENAESLLPKDEANVLQGGKSDETSR